MTLDVSEAIALAKDLLQTSGDFHPYDPALAAQFSDRAYEICDDLGIDRTLLGETAAEVVVESVVESVDDDVSSTPNATAPAPLEDDVEQTSRQLRSLLQQQAEVLKTVRETEDLPKPKTKKRSFRLFGRSADGGMGHLQTA